MNLPVIHRLVLATAVLVGVATLACGGSEVEPTVTPIAGTAAPAPTAKAEPTATPPPRPYDLNAMMFRLLPGLGMRTQTMFSALEQVRRHRDTALVPVLVEVLRFAPTGSYLEAVGAALQDLTGQSIDPYDGLEWFEWLGQHRQEFELPDEYAIWKIHLFSQIDPRFEVFLSPAIEGARIDLTEVAWGGVPPDGIPDLRNPPTIPPQEAEYLSPDERVFGVSINGEHRAYPLRIVNAHEMANDVLGGEPIALMW